MKNQRKSREGVAAFFYELVKNNSQPSTIEWLKKHPPSEDDWLAPLNFNYR